MCDIVGGREKFQAQSIFYASIIDRMTVALLIFFSIFVFFSSHLSITVFDNTKVITNGDVLDTQHDENERNRNIR